MHSTVFSIFTIVFSKNVQNINDCDGKSKLTCFVLPASSIGIDAANGYERIQFQTPEGWGDSWHVRMIVKNSFTSLDAHSDLPAQLKLNYAPPLIEAVAIASSGALFAVTISGKNLCNQPLSNCGSLYRCSTDPNAPTVPKIPPDHCKSLDTLDKADFDTSFKEIDILSWTHTQIRVKLATSLGYIYIQSSSGSGNGNIIGAAPGLKSNLIKYSTNLMAIVQGDDFIAENNNIVHKLHVSNPISTSGSGFKKLTIWVEKLQNPPTGVKVLVGDTSYDCIADDIKTTVSASGSTLWKISFIVPAGSGARNAVYVTKNGIRTQNAAYLWYALPFISSIEIQEGLQKGQSLNMGVLSTSGGLISIEGGNFGLDTMKDYSLIFQKKTVDVKTLSASITSGSLLTWTITLNTAQTIVQAKDVAVTQGSKSGTLTTALSVSGTVITVTAYHGTIFDTSADLNIGSSSTVAVTSITAGVVVSAALSFVPVVGDSLRIESAPSQTCGTIGIFKVTSADSATGFTLDTAMADVGQFVCVIGRSTRVVQGNIASATSNMNSDCTFHSHEELKCALPPGEGTGFGLSLVVGGQSPLNGVWDSISYGIPTVTAVTPKKAPTLNPGIITITGTNFGISTPIVTVLGSGHNCTVLSHTHVEIKCQLKNGQGANHQIVVIADGQKSNPPDGQKFNYLFSYNPPVINAFTPNFGRTDGLAVVLPQQMRATMSVTGLNFGESTNSKFSLVFTANGETSNQDQKTSSGGSGVVKFVVPNVDILERTHSLIRFYQPPGYGADVSLTVAVDGQTSANIAKRFVYETPTVKSIQPHCESMHKKTGALYEVECYGYKVPGFLNVQDYPKIVSIMSDNNGVSSVRIQWVDATQTFLIEVGDTIRISGMKNSVGIGSNKKQNFNGDWTVTKIVETTLFQFQSNEKLKLVGLPTPDTYLGWNHPSGNLRALLSKSYQSSVSNSFKSLETDGKIVFSPTLAVTVIVVV